jgi:hypothetical protein
MADRHKLVVSTTSTRYRHIEDLGLTDPQELLPTKASCVELYALSPLTSILIGRLAVGSCTLLVPRNEMQTVSTSCHSAQCILSSPRKHAVSLLTAGNKLTCMKDDEQNLIFAPQQEILPILTTCGCKRLNYSTAINT